MVIITFIVIIFSYMYLSTPTSIPNGPSSVIVTEQVLNHTVQCDLTYNTIQ